MIKRKRSIIRKVNQLFANMLVNQKAKSALWFLLHELTILINSYLIKTSGPAIHIRKYLIINRENHREYPMCKPKCSFRAGLTKSCFTVHTQLNESYK